MQAMSASSASLAATSRHPETFYSSLAPLLSSSEHHRRCPSPPTPPLTASSPPRPPHPTHSRSSRPPSLRATPTACTRMHVKRSALRASAPRSASHRGPASRNSSGCRRIVLASSELCHHHHSMPARSYSARTAHRGHHRRRHRTPRARMHLCATRNLATSQPRAWRAYIGHLPELPHSCVALHSTPP